MADNKTKADQLKAQGNDALKKGDDKEALRLYTEALALDDTNEVLYSNRSATYAKQGNYMKALEDAEKAIEAKPSWGKGWSRKGTALCYLKRFEEAKIAFEEGLKVDPDNQQMKDGLKEADGHLTGPGQSQPLTNPFSAPDAVKRLEANPKTKKFLQDPVFRMQLEMVRTTGNLGSISDPRMIECLGLLLGVNFEHMEMKDIPDGENLDSEPDPSPPRSPSPPKHSQAKTSKQSEPETNSSPELTKSEKQAVAAKERGNEAYKAKNFEAALAAYDEAISLDPSNMTFINNKAAVYFEMQKYIECIETCEKAVEVGRDNRADFTIIAKALAREGKAYLKMGDEANALRFLNKSLSEHRVADIAKLVVEVNKQMKEKERLAYINPDLALEEKNKGNELFQKGKYPEALRNYNEAIKRNPEDPKLYSNRAACYTKLMEFQLALRDCEECLKIDPKFIKGYLRKGAIYTAMKDVSKATAAYQKALEIDPNCSEAQEGYKNGLLKESSDPEAVRRRAMENPEIQEILADPAMRHILEQMQKDPNALREHLKNPEVASRIEKLLEAGIIAIR